MPSGSHTTPRREHLAQPRDTSQLRGEEPESLLTLTSVTTRLHHWLLLDSAQQQSFRIARTITPAMKSQRSKYPLTPAGTVIDSGRYLDIPIPTIKHDNLNGYGRILTADHESWRKIHTISYITNSLLKGQDFSWRRQTLVMRKPSCNIEKKIVNLSSLLPVVFFHSGFPRKNPCLCMFVDWFFTFRIILGRPLLLISKLFVM